MFRGLSFGRLFEGSGVTISLAVGQPLPWTLLRVPRSASDNYP